MDPCGPLEAVSFLTYRTMAISIALPAAVGIATPFMKIEDKRNEVTQSAGTDPESGLPIALTSERQKLLDFPHGRWTKAMLILSIVSVGSLFWYAVAENVPPLSASTTYDCVIVGATYLALVLPLLTYGLLVRLIFYLIELYQAK